MAGDNILWLIMTNDYRGLILLQIMTFKIHINLGKLQQRMIYEQITDKIRQTIDDTYIDILWGMTDDKYQLTA